VVFNIKTPSELNDNKGRMFASDVNIHEEKTLMITAMKKLSHVAQARHFPKLLRIELLTVIFIKILILIAFWYVCFSTPPLSSHHNNIISQHLLEN
jgi:hypothetical protein